ncbi:uncharacterized protein N0V89_012126 [Didymosphaeria variabile]|uniref:Cytochrome P450 n=1 Tax=Didymosphaeria variabile TaxID=1932322 RepID=A0A9W9C535_9PLEO|nr:uncharacterized protein N0V89_012126 [Didymosphaeria variabile]KAJ4344386.1 hypothetical protein N0V89_012126 [Didymosphaeria variabile]
MAPVSPKVIAPFCLGVAMHLGFFIRGEWHLRAPTIFLAHALVFILLSAKQLVSALPTWHGVALPFLDRAAIKQYYQRITTHALELESIISAQKAKPIVMNDLLYQMTFDVLKDIGFGQANMEIKDGASVLGGSLSILGPTTPSPWILRMAFALFPGAWNIPHWFKFLAFTQSIVEKRIQSEPESVDIASFFIEDSQRKDADKISREAVGGDCGVILLAGSTSGPSLILLFYCLARWPEHAEKIRQELRNVDYNDMTALSALPHLTATINESMRLYPAGPTFGSRITPPDGLNCEGVYIPGGIKVVAPRYSLGRLEEAYEAPHEFIPERWYSKPELVKDKRAFAPFSMGRNSCAGKKVAMSEMRLTVAILVSKYSIRFAPGTSDGLLVEKNMRDQLTPLPGELKLVFEKL